MSPRPKLEITKNNQYRIRLTDKELSHLEECCELTGLNKADVIRQGVELVYEKAKNKK
ncbi:MAG: hypothetical protein JJE17_01780 [Peptostreptococcaceae bacterium]|nr:hypothetical protein [Peptostreptococcaceae bacterium]